MHLSKFVDQQMLHGFAMLFRECGFPRLRTDSVKACNHMEFSVKRKNVEAAYQRFLGKNYPCDAIDVKKIFRVSSWCEKR